MTIKELIEKLSAYPEDLRVIIAKDMEGNSFSPAEEADLMVYEEENTWSGMAFVPEDVDAPEEFESVVTLWPVN